jgi:hypothetical protein
MSLNYDITKDIRFQQGIEKGEVIGIEKGEALKTYSMTIKLLKQNTMTTSEIADFVEMPISFVLQCQTELEGK